MLSYFVLTFCFVVYNAYGNEPHSCSQFHYVDKLLDKMIRMEVKVENYDKEITETNTEVQSVLEELKSERERFRNDIKEMKEQLENDITSLTDSLTMPNVVFKARYVKDTSLEVEQIIVFKETIFNYGNGYDNMTGIFTAPVSGTYLFNFHMCVTAGNSLYYEIVLNGESQTAGRFYDGDAHQCYTVDDILPLKAGHKVWMKCAYSTSTLYEAVTLTYNYWNTFSGTLIQKRIP